MIEGAYGQMKPLREINSFNSIVESEIKRLVEDDYSYRSFGATYPWHDKFSAMDTQDLFAGLPDTELQYPISNWQADLN